MNTEADNLARFADSLLFSPTHAAGARQPVVGNQGVAMPLQVGGDGGGIDFQEIANYFNLPSPLPNITPPSSTSNITGGQGGFVFSFDNVPVGPGRINPIVAAAFVNPTARQQQQQQQAKPTNLVMATGPNGKSTGGEHTTDSIDPNNRKVNL